MRPWLAAFRGGRWSDSTSFGGTGSPACIHCVEALEPRTLLSASLTPAFTGQFPTTLTADRSARVTVRLTNPGDQPARGAAVRLYASADASLDAGDVLLGTGTRRGAIKPGRSGSVKVRFDSPASLAGGSYYLIASAAGATAPFDSIPDSSAPAVVASSSPVRVEPSFVDLSARITRLPHEEVEVGGSGHDSLVEIEVSNAGNAPAVGPVEVRLYLSADPNLDGADTAAGVEPPHALKIAPGRTRTIPARLAVPAGTTPGLYYVLAVVDSSNAIVETDETNNLAASAAPISVVTASTHDHGDGGDHHDHHHYHGYFGAGGYYDVGGYYDDAGYYDDSGYVPADDGGGGGDLPPDGSGPPAQNEPPASEPSTEPSDTPSTQPSDDGSAYDSSGSDWSGASSGPYDDYSGGGSDF
jgi:hypothetical protein